LAARDEFALDGESSALSDLQALVTAVADPGSNTHPESQGLGHDDFPGAREAEALFLSFIAKPPPVGRTGSALTQAERRFRLRAVSMGTRTLRQTR
jgi:hypothetical protein